MPYRIEYQATKKVRGAEKRREPLSALTALCFLLLLLLAGALWPEGAAALRSLVIPGEAAVTVGALEDLAGDLRSGTGIQEALDGFCRQVSELD